MVKLRGGRNPFYAMLVIAGVVFSVTACAYGVMAFRQARPGSHAMGENEKGLLAILDRNGAAILGGEVVLLALLTVGAIGTDSYWDKQKNVVDTATREESGQSTSKESTHESQPRN